MKPTYSNSSEAARYIVDGLSNDDINDACTKASSTEPHWPPPQGLLADGLQLMAILSHFRLQFARRLGQHIK